MVLSAAYREQAGGGHIQSNAALIVFAVFLQWLSIATQGDQQFCKKKKKKCITVLCEATAVREANLPNRKTVRATFSYPQY